MQPLLGSKTDQPSDRFWTDFWWDPCLSGSDPDKRYLYPQGRFGEAAYKVADVRPWHQNSKSYFIEFQLRENTALENLSKSNTIIDTEHHTVKLFVNFCKFKEEDWQNLSKYLMTNEYHLQIFD